jgi:hypothetical protein
MAAVPAPTAVTIPVVASTVATDILLLLQVPPAFPLLVYVAVAPIQNCDAPLIVPAVALGSTVKIFDDDDGLAQPLPMV